MVQKVPPPPPLAVNDQALNRWLLELTGILNNQGGIDPASITGFAALSAQVAANTAAIAANTAAIAANATAIAAANAAITTLQGQVNVLQGNGVPLNGIVAPAAGLGKVGDWYGNTTGGVGARVYIKTGVATWTAFPF